MSVVANQFSNFQQKMHQNLVSTQMQRTPKKDKLVPNIKVSEGSTFNFNEKWVLPYTYLHTMCLAYLWLSEGMFNLMYQTLYMTKYLMNLFQLLSPGFTCNLHSNLWMILNYMNYWAWNKAMKFLDRLINEVLSVINVSF